MSRLPILFNLKHYNTVGYIISKFHFIWTSMNFKKN